MQRIVLAVEYHGAGFVGWQSQPNKQGIQDSVELALQQIAGHSVRIHAAGRTDAGVHALMQVIHFDTKAMRPNDAWVRGVNAFLPPNIRIKWACKVDAGFHARFSARGRHYQYALINQSSASAIHANSVGWYHGALNISAMQASLQYLMGEHDFSAFRASECQAKSPIRTITHANINQKNQYVIFDFSANAFLQHQVRNMVGAIIYVGAGKHQPDYIQFLLNQRDRTKSPPTFSPNGLYLTGVDYESKWGLPESRSHLLLL